MSSELSPRPTPALGNAMDLLIDFCANQLAPISNIEFSYSSMADEMSVCITVDASMVDETTWNTEKVKRIFARFLRSRAPGDYFVAGKTFRRPRAGTRPNSVQMRSTSGEAAIQMYERLMRYTTATDADRDEMDRAWLVEYHEAEIARLSTTGGQR